MSKGKKVWSLMTRVEKILSRINVNGQGIEIGPSHNPIAPKKDGYKVHIIDCANREQLIEKFKVHDISGENIEEVDFIWSGQSYSELVGKAKFYDWIIASHVIEHTPDLIGFLNNCDSIIKDDAVISLAIPDKRYCFDHFRPITGISKIIDNYFQKHTMHSPGTVAECHLNMVTKGEKIGWGDSCDGKYNFLHSLQEVQSQMNRVINGKEYVDSHAWCFTPHSFRLIVHDLSTLGLIPFKEVAFSPADGCEFFMTLGRCGEGSKLSRLEMLEIIESEISVRPPKEVQTAEIQTTEIQEPSIKKFLKRLVRR
jgi:2-polyprenyl-3-methyl-5-hydroxy-6-metoxy-1,4-benzoquinol methylase